MAIVEIGIICLSVVSCVGIVACAAYLAIIRRTEIQQAGIDRRAAAKSSTLPDQPEKEWYQTAIESALQSPELMKVITPYIPGLVEKFGIKKV